MIHLPLADIRGSCNKLDILKPHLCFDGASVIALFERVVLALDCNDVVDGHFVSKDNETVLPFIVTGPYTGPKVVFGEATVPLNSVAILC